MGRFLPLTQLYRKIELPPVLFTVATAPICVIGELSAKQTEGLFALTLIEPDKFVKLAALHQSFVKIWFLSPTRLDEYTSFGV